MIRALLWLGWFLRAGLHQLSEEGNAHRRIRRRYDIDQMEIDHMATNSRRSGEVDVIDAAGALEDHEELPTLAETTAEPLLEEPVLAPRPIDVVVNVRLARTEHGADAICVYLPHNGRLTAAEAQELMVDLDIAKQQVASIRTACGFTS